MVCLTSWIMLIASSSNFCTTTANGDTVADESSEKTTKDVLKVLLAFTKTLLSLQIQQSTLFLYTTIDVSKRSSTQRSEHITPDKKVTDSLKGQRFPAEDITSQGPPKVFESSSSEVSEGIASATAAMNSTFNLTSSIPENFNTVEDSSPLVASIENNIYISFLSLAMIVGIPGNGLIFFMHTRFKTKRNTDWYILFVAIYDFLFLTTTVPIHLLMRTSIWKYIYTEVVCKLHMLFCMLCLISEIITITVLALERYYKTCHHDIILCTYKRGKRVNIVIFTTVLIVSLPGVIVIEWSKENKECLPLKTQLVVKFYLISLMTVLTCMLCILFFVYTRVGIELGRTVHTFKERDKCFDDLSRIECRLSSVDMTLPMNVRRSQSDLGVTFSGSSPLPDTLNEHTPNGGGKEQHNDILCTEDVVTCRNMIKSEVKTIWTIRVPSVEIPEIETTNGTMNMVSDTVSETKGRSTQYLVKVSAASPDPKQHQCTNKVTTLDNQCSENSELSKKRKHALKITKIVAIVSAIFILSWIPTFTWFVLRIFGYIAESSDANILPMSVLVNKFANVFVYILGNPFFIKKLRRTLCCRKSTAVNPDYIQSESGRTYNVSSSV